ncbi:MAG: integrase [Alphaproteobacteria bacterium]|nr:MAG: integrase [Alphaproteobacteria bacterium]
MRSVQNFIDEIGDIDMHKITRAHGRAFYNWWGERIAPKDGKKGLNPNSANRDIGNLRTLFRVYWEYEGDESRANPFQKLTYTESFYKDIPSFSDKWMREKIMKPGMFDKLKNETGLLVLALIETGCRPSEIANILPKNICLDHKVPHIKIRPRENMQLKSNSASRDIPLVGISLEAFKKAPRGFPHYIDNATLLSNNLMKAFRLRKLFPTKDHRVYSIRHSYEKRMLEAGIDYDLRCTLMGHSNNRPDYGDGGSLEFRRNELLKIVHPVPQALIDSLDAL